MKRREFLGLAGATLLFAPRISIAQTSTSRSLRIVIVANKYYEGDGLMVALCNELARNPKLGIPETIAWPRLSPSKGGTVNAVPRCTVKVFHTDATKKDLIAVMEIWCLDDLGQMKGDASAKASAMGMITRYGPPPDGVVAFGTAGYPGLGSNNGCATIGSTIFIHDASKDGAGPHGNWTWQDHPENMEMLVPSATPPSFYSSIAADQTVLKTIGHEMIAPQNSPAGVLQLLIAPDAVGISSVNIPEHAEYCDVDTKAIELAKQRGATNIASVETTHGVIRSVWQDAPFIFVTAIPNRVCHFLDEALDPDRHNNYAQEFAASHNAGVALKHVMPYFAGAIAK